MDDNTHTNGPIMNGDDELAKALNGGLKFEETPPGSDGNDAAQVTTANDDQGSSQNLSDTNDDTPPTIGDLPAPHVSQDGDDSTPVVQPHVDSGDAVDSAEASDLDQLKSSALDDLKPLVGKLNLSPEEKFDTLLLIIRSTDDQTMLAEAHAAAKEISDDTKRAQALLDIIKEVDYFNSKK